MYLRANRVKLGPRGLRRLLYRLVRIHGSRIAIPGDTSCRVPFDISFRLSVRVAFLMRYVDFTDRESAIS